MSHVTMTSALQSRKNPVVAAEIPNAANYFDTLIKHAYAHIVRTHATTLG
jgi:hypothetical protein